MAFKGGLPTESHDRLKTSTGRNFEDAMVRTVPRDIHLQLEYFGSIVMEYCG